VGYAPIGRELRENVKGEVGNRTGKLATCRRAMCACCRCSDAAHKMKCKKRSRDVTMPSNSLRFAQSRARSSREYRRLRTTGGLEPTSQSKGDIVTYNKLTVVGGSPPQAAPAASEMNWMPGAGFTG
jgi:hypothetical protein